MIGFTVWGLITILIHQTLILMVKIHRPTIYPISVFKLQLTQLINRASNVNVENGILSFSFDEQQFAISCKDSRVVKEPGYEILIDEVTTCQIDRSLMNVCTKDKCEAMSTRHDFNT
ncbi:hypothetical protein ERAQ111492_01730 [Erysipelothrix aquatica]|uniref:hypothetical protein n=1 Tax=Erysipelothrix aquatica TaxID=2683714 RepID=UPI00135B85AF|nr:hypothetical protein [Erysipelothrix aquatica]